MFQNLHRSVQEGFVDVLETQQKFTKQNEAYYKGLKDFGAPPDISQEVLGQPSLNRLATATQTFDPYTQRNQQTVTDAAVSAVILSNPRPGQVNSVSAQEAERCRRLTGLSGIEQMIRENAANPTKPIRCGVRYKPSGGIVPAVAQGAYGSAKGPLLTTPADALGNGVQWIWDLEEARKTLLRDSAKNMGGSCDTLNLLPFLQNGVYQNKLGYCATSKKFIPIENGKARYPRDSALNCGQESVVTSAARCPPAPRPGSIPGRPTSPGAVNLRNCSASGVGLTRDCLLQAVKTAGCSDKGTLYTSLQKAPNSAPQVDGDLNMKRAFRDYQMEQGSAALSPNLFRQGRATMSVALADVGRLQTAANTGRTAKIKNAAFDLCYKAGEYDKYNFCGDLVDTALLSTVDLTCLQQYWQSKGGKPAGRAYPRTAGAAIPALGNPRTWGDYKRAVDAMVAAVQSNNTNAQSTAYLEFLGIELGPNPYVDFSFPRWESSMLNLVESAVNQGTQIEFLGNQTHRRGAVWYNKKVSAGAFQTQFQFSIQGNPEADGLCFVIQNESPTALGWHGGFNGFAGIQKGVAVMFDYSPGSSMGIYTSSEYTPSRIRETHEFSSAAIDFKRGNRFSVDIQYANNLFNVKILNMDTGGTYSFQKQVYVPVVVGDQAWVGFTAASGGYRSRPVVYSWSYSEGVTGQGTESSTWKCLPGVPVPLRKGFDGEIECMSNDGRNCSWQTNDANCNRLLTNPVTPDNPLKCGTMTKSIYGITGYDQPGHWCSKGRQQL